MAIGVALAAALAAALGGGAAEGAKMRDRNASANAPRTMTASRAKAHGPTRVRRAAGFALGGRSRGAACASSDESMRSVFISANGFESGARRETTSSSASPNASRSGKRRARSLLKARARTASSCFGSEGRTVLGAGGSSRRISATSAAADAPTHGKRPVTASYAVTASAN
jgi:hypothetical protein